MAVRWFTLGALLAAMATPAAAIEVFAFSTLSYDGTLLQSAYSIDPTQATVNLSQTFAGVTLQGVGSSTIGEGGIVLRSQAKASGTLTAPLPDGFMAGAAFAGFSDRLVVNDTARNGTAGSISIRLDYDGVLSGHGGGGYYSNGAFGVACQIYALCSDAAPYQLVSLGSIFGISDLTQSAAGQVTVGTFDFIFGTPFELSLYVVVSGGRFGPVGSTTVADTDFSHTATLAPAVVRDALGQHVYGASILSLDSDFEYAVAVPEPGAWALMIVGFGATGALFRRRRDFPTLA